MMPIPATVCDLTGGADEADCLAAIASARSKRMALWVAPVAVAVPECPDTRSCPFATYAVAFATREDDPAPWSETLLVSLDPVAPRVLPWPADVAAPARLLRLQEGLPGLGQRLGEEVPIPTSPPVPDGTESVCLTARTGGTLVRHPAWGVALVDELGFTRVTWPAGWTAREAPEGIVVVDASGETVIRERMAVHIGGGMTAPGEWLTCGEVSPAFRL